MPHPQVDVRFDHTIIAARDKHHHGAHPCAGRPLLGRPPDAQARRDQHQARGRGVYFDDPAGHHLEAITARYDGYPSLI